MNWRKKLIKNSQIYTILDKQVLGQRDLFQTTRSLNTAKSDIIQLRDKNSCKKSILKEAKAMSKLISRKKTIFIINDYIDIAMIVNSDGVHIGQDDLPIEEVRKLVGKDMIIGVSCHSLKQATEAEDKGADYVGIGPIYPTNTKPDYTPVGLDLLKQCSKKIQIPFFAIGGINLTNLKQVINAGAKRITVCSAIITAKDIIKTTTSFKTFLKESSLA